MSQKLIIQREGYREEIYAKNMHEGMEIAWTRSKATGLGYDVLDSRDRLVGDVSPSRKNTAAWVHHPVPNKATIKQQSSSLRFVLVGSLITIAIVSWLLLPYVH